MLRTYLTLMLVSSMLSTSLLDVDLTAPTLDTKYSAVLPKETVQFECKSPNPSNISVTFHLFRDETQVEVIKAENKTTFTVTAETSGQYSCDYQGSSSINSSRSSNVNITVVNLLQPNISFSASHDWFHWWLQDLEVTRGNSFSIICYTQPQYPGGSFHLMFNGIPNKTQSADNHSSTFVFDEAEYVHQGNYSCVYEVIVFSRTFNSSSSELLAVNVKVSLVPFISLAAAAGLFFTSLPIIIFCIKKRQKKKSHSYRVRTLEENETAEMDEDDYENAVMVLQQRNDSDDSGEDYVDIDADLEKRRVGNNKKCADAKRANQITCTRNDTEDEDDDYENPEKGGSLDSDEDYINVSAEVEKTAIQCIDAKNTNRITCLRKEMETTDPEKEDSDDTDDDYINVDETEAQNQCADAKYTQSTAELESDTDDGDDYENPDANVQQTADSDVSDEDYINVN